MWQPLPRGQVTIGDGFWKRWRDLIGETTLAHQYEEMRAEGQMDAMLLDRKMHRGRELADPWADADGGAAASSGIPILPNGWKPPPRASSKPEMTRSRRASTRLSPCSSERSYPTATSTAIFSPGVRSIDSRISGICTNSIALAILSRPPWFILRRPKRSGS